VSGPYNYTSFLQIANLVPQYVWTHVSSNTFLVNCLLTVFLPLLSPQTLYTHPSGNQCCQLNLFPFIPSFNCTVFLLLGLISYHSDGGNKFHQKYIFPQVYRACCSVEVLSYKPEGHRFETWWGNWISICLILPAALEPGVYSVSNRNEYRRQKQKMFLGSKMQTVHKAALTAICQLIA
jgi:hypothetical protein